jgi:hypothetical protein
MKEEFNLSEKIIEIRPAPMPTISFDNDTIPKKDVKEFVRLLKIYIDKTHIIGRLNKISIIDEIDKLAGEKLK